MHGKVPVNGTISHIEHFVNGKKQLVQVTLHETMPSFLIVCFVRMRHSLPSILVFSPALPSCFAWNLFARRSRLATTSLAKGEISRP